MKIGILQATGHCGEIVKHTFNNAEMQELYKPVIYSKENNNDKNVGSDVREGKIDGIVVAPGAQFDIEGALKLHITDSIRIASAYEGKELNEIYNIASAEHLDKVLESLWHSMKRDFIISNPRIALIALNPTLEDTEKNILEPLVKECQKKGINTYGPYLFEEFINEQHYKHFDCTLVLSDTQCQNAINSLSDTLPSTLIMDMPVVVTKTNIDAEFLDQMLESHNDDNENDDENKNDKGKGNVKENIKNAEPNEQMTANRETASNCLRRAYYIANDIARNRRTYDKATSHPLPKLYHERRDESEKVRFAVKKEPKAE